MEQIFLRIGFLLFAITVANLGTTQYAAHQIGMNMMSLSFSFGDGLSVASVALIGRSLGQERRDLAKLYASMCQRARPALRVCDVHGVSVLRAKPLCAVLG